MSDASVLRVFGNAEFRTVWAAELLSLLGDQLARVAVAVLVYDRTSSATAATLAYALTFVPAVLGGVGLSWLADRYRRRTVMIVADVLRAALVAVMALPGLPLPLLGALVVAVVLLRAPHSAAQGALLPQILGDRYEQGLAVRQITAQIAQVGGFGIGGLVVAALTPSGALLLDAATFVVSAVLVRVGVAARERPDPVPDATPGPAPRFTVGTATILRDPERRALVLLALVVGCYVVPEAVAAPYAAQLGAGPAAVGLLMAAVPLGGVAGAWAYVRYVPLALRERTLGLTAALAGVPLLPTLAVPPVPVAMACWALSGAFATSYMLQAQAGFVRRTPDGLRGQAIGVASSAIVASQGLAVVLGGIVADAWQPSVAVAAGGAAGVVTAAVAGVVWARARGTAPAIVPAPAGP